MTDRVNEMLSVDFGGRPLPVWKYEDLYYVTFNPKIIKECLAGLFDFPNLVPDQEWVSGGTPDIAISAATYNATIQIIEKVQKQTRNAVKKVKGLAEKAEDEARSARDSGPWYDGHVAGGFHGWHNLPWNS